MSKQEPENLYAREWKRMRNRVVWSLAGWNDAWKNEHSFRSWVYANAISLVFAFTLPISNTERMVIVVLGVLVLASELFNTAIERLTDLVSQDYSDLARRTKDAGSAGVAVTAIAAGVAWVWALVRLAM